MVILLKNSMKEMSMIVNGAKEIFKSRPETITLFRHLKKENYMLLPSLWVNVYMMPSLVLQPSAF